jgi:DNA-cytosine methyltransferase
MTLTALSLFAGVGGFDLALSRAGVTVTAACEIDAAARGVLKHRFPETTLFEDVCEVTPDAVESTGFMGSNGVIVGGFPCQDLSVAGKRAGLSGARSGLFWEILRLAEGTRAKWLVLENVPGLLSSNGGRDMGTVIGAMADLGYGVSWRVLDAQHFGVPQRRRRVFLVGRLRDDGRASAEVLDLSQGRIGHLEASLTKRQNASRATAKRTRNGSAVGNFELYDFPDGDVAPTLNAQRARDTMTWSPELARMQSFGQYETDGTASTVKARDYKDATDLVITPFVKSKRAQTDQDDEAWVDDAPAPTLNRMDNSGESRATVLAVMQDARELEKHQNGLGVADGDAPAYTLDQVSEQAVAVLMRNREGSNDQTLFQPLLLDGTRVGDPRIHDDISPTVMARWGTGGNNVPMAVQEASVYPIDTRNATRDPEKRDAQNRQGLGLGEDGDPSSTVTTAFTPAVAYSIREDAQADRLSATEIETARALQSTRPSVQSHHAQTFIAGTMAVRRLTPTECERLQGFPDGWTSVRWDWKKSQPMNQADSARYKQMGNAVAVPVVQWIIDRLVQVDGGDQ